MPKKTISMELDKKTLQPVGQKTEATRQYFSREEWFICEVEKGVEAANEGRLKEHSEVKAKWEAKRAAH